MDNQASPQKIGIILMMMNVDWICYMTKKCRMNCRSGGKCCNLILLQNFGWSYCQKMNHLFFGQKSCSTSRFVFPTASSFISMRQYKSRFYYRFTKDTTEKRVFSDEKYSSLTFICLPLNYLAMKQRRKIVRFKTHRRRWNWRWILLFVSVSDENWDHKFFIANRDEYICGSCSIKIRLC